MVILVLSAFQSETGSLRKKYGALEAAAERSFHLYHAAKGGATVRFGTTGEGKDNVRRFFEWYTAKAGSHDLPDLVLSTGYAGALKKDLKAGDIVVAENITDLSTGKAYRLETPSALREKFPPCGGLTVGRLTGSADKTDLFLERPDAAFVDMESSAVLDFCVPKRVPCWVVRSVSDPAGFRFPAKEFVRDNWRDIPVKLWLYRILTDPADFLRAVRLQGNLVKARKNITQTVSTVIDSLVKG